MEVAALRSMHEVTDDTEALTRAVVAYARGRITNDQPLDRPASPDELTRRVGETVTSGGLGGEEALRIWEEILAPATLSTDHPAFLAFVPGAPTKASVLFDLAISASATYGGSWIEGAGAVWAENQVLAWLAQVVGMPADAGGCFVSGGTAGNLSALVAARHAATIARGGSRPVRWRIAVADTVHSSVASAARVMDADVVAVPHDDRGRLTGDGLAAALEGAGEDVFAVVASAGSTNAGVVDDLAGVAEVCSDRALWLHVDAAYGGAALLAPSVRDRFRGIERADSFIVDPHKWLFAPYDCCALVYRDPVLARAAHTQKAGYLDPVTVEGEWNPSDFSIQLTRRARGLPFWFSLAVHGTQAYTDAVEQTLATARAGRKLIEDAEHLRLVMEPDLSVLIFERIGWQQADYDAWSNRAMLQGFAFVTPTKHNGQVCTRFAIVNPVTTPEDLSLIIDSMR
jgi:L-2,4-diaminobutyrate decarboxylase